MMAIHIEFALFLWTLVAMVPTVRWLLGRNVISSSWAAMFLFPGFFVYDFNLGGGSDHVAAFFALPLFLAAVRMVEYFEPGISFAAGLLCGAAVQTKLQGVQLVAPLTAYIAVCWMLAARSSRVQRRDLWLGPVLFASGLLAGFGPHLIKNGIFYGNPVYPLLQDVFRSRPSFPDSAMLNSYLGVAFDRVPPRQLLPRVASSIRLTFSLPFLSYMSMFGFLLSLMTPITLLGVHRRRLRLGVLLALGAVITWALTYRVERNLQLTVPWLAAVTAASIAALWERGNLVRLALVPLVGLQIVWGSRFVLAGGPERVQSSFALLSRDVERKPEGRYDQYRAGFRALGNAVPKGGVLLLHTGNLHLGINRTTMQDWMGFQHLIDYRTMQSPLDVYRRFRELGITHMCWNNFDFPTMKIEDALFVTFTRQHARYMGDLGGFSLWEMPAEPPPATQPLQVTVVGIPGYSDGLYGVSKLGVIDPLPADRKSYPPPDVAIAAGHDLAFCIQRSQVVLMSDHAPRDGATASSLGGCFTKEVTYHAGYSVYLRNRTPACAPSPLSPR
jgi:hypothetical protein